MHELDDLAAQLDVAVAVNSLVMPDVRLIDRTLRSIRASLKPGGLFLGIVPSIDTICYHLMLLMDRGLDQGLEPKEAQRIAALQAQRRHYDFAFGEFRFEGLRQKFWQSFEIEYRLNKAGFVSTTLGKVLYPWDESVVGSDTLAGFPRNWDWFFQASDLTTAARRKATSQFEMAALASTPRARGRKRSIASNLNSTYAK